MNINTLKNKKIILILSISFVMVFSLFYRYMSIKSDVYHDINPSTDEIEYSLDVVFVGPDQLYLSGWIAKIGVDSNPYYVKAILYNEQENIGYGRRAQTTKREDITSYLSDGCNHDDSGFVATFDYDLNIPKGNYEVVLQLRIDVVDYFVFTNETVEIK